MTNKTFLAAAVAVMTGGAANAATDILDFGFSTTPNGGFGGYVVQSIKAIENNLAGIKILVGGSNFDQEATISIGLYGDLALTNELGFGTVDVDTNDDPGATGVNTFATVEWDPVETIIGQTYYLKFDTTNPVVGFYVSGTPVLDEYADGQVVAAIGNDPYVLDTYTDIASATGLYDPDFTPDDPTPGAEVPLPAGLPLLLAGLGGLAVLRRKA